MPQPNEMLPAMYTAPMASGINPTPMYGMEGMPLPFGSDPRVGLAGQFLLAPHLRGAMGPAGFSPMGLGHDQNVFDTMRKQQYTQMQTQLIQGAASRDRDNMFRTFRGMSAMAGIGFGAEQRRAANSLADLTTMAAPVLTAMNPDLLDQMGGSRGSAAVMARRMIDASRYRIDPVTGRLGSSQATTGALVDQVYGDLFERGDRREMGNLTAGQAGALYGELTNRGMVQGDARQPYHRSYEAVREMARSSPDALARAARTAGVNVPGDLGRVSPGDLDKLANTDEVGGRLRAFDATKISRTIKGYAGAVSAIRDIFGDMGRPNAPMQELLGGLEALTMGSLAQIDPGRAGTIARQTYNLAKQTGVTLDSAMVLQQHAGARAQQLGLDPIFAVQATQGALAFGGAYRSQGHAAHTAHGAFNADQMTQLDANLRLQAAGSNMANQLGAAMRLRESAGGFRAGTDAARFTAAVTAGTGEFVDGRGRTRSLNMSQGEFMAMMREGGVDEGTVRDVLDQRDTNREQIDRYGIAGLVRREQATGEMQPQVALRLGETLAARLRGVGGLSDEQIRGAIDKAAPAAARRVMGMSTEAFARTGAREAEIGRILETELAGTEAGGAIAAMPREERDRFLRTTAGQFYGNMDRFVRTSDYRGMGSFQNVHRVMNADVMREAERSETQARFTGEMQEALSPLGRGTALSRTIDAMQEVREGDADGMQRVMLRAFGGVDQREVNLALQGPLAAISRRRAEAERLQVQASRTPDSAERTKLMEQLDATMRELRTQADSVAQTAERFGIYRDGGLTPEHTERALRSTDSVARTMLDLAGVRGSFGSEVARPELEQAAAGYGAGRMTPEEAAVVIMARRQADPALGVTDEQVKQAREQGGNRNTEEQVRAALVAQRRAAVGRISDGDLAAEMAGGRIDLSAPGGEAAARALALHRRGQIPLRGSAERVRELAAAHHVSPDQAQSWADTEQRARRLGINQDEINRWERGDPAAGIPRHDNAWEATNAIIRDREARRFVVTDDDRRAFVTEQGLGDRLDLNTAEGRGAADNLILRRRQAEERERFAAFRQSDDGSRFREDVDMRGQDVEQVMTQLVSSPQMMRRFGMWSIKMHDDLKAGQQQLRELAMVHAGGDMSRLVMGNTDIDAGTPEGAAREARVRAEVQAVIAQQTSIVRGAHGTHGMAGRQLQLGSAGEALIRGQQEGDPNTAPVFDLVRRRALMAVGLDEKLQLDTIADPRQRQAALDRFHVEASNLRTGDWQGVTAEHRNAVERVQEQLGNEHEALGLLGVRAMPGEKTAQETLARVAGEAAQHPDRLVREGRVYALENYDRTVRAVAAARRIRPEDEEILSTHRERMRRVEAFAAAHGTTPGELGAVLTGVAAVPKLSPFSPEEERAVGGARTAVGDADREAAEARTQIQGAEYTLAQTGLTAEQRRDAEGSLAAARRRLEDAGGRRTAAIGGLDEMARRRGTTGERLLTTEEGRLTPQQIQSVAEDMAELGKSTPQVNALTAGLGISVADLDAVDRFVRQGGEARQREALEREQNRPIDLINEMRQAFGFQKMDQGAENAIGPRASNFSGAEQRRLLQSVIGTQSSLVAQATDAAGTLRARIDKHGADSPEGRAAAALLAQMQQPGKPNAGRDVMTRQYQDAMAEAEPGKRREALDRFRTTFGLSDGGFARFEQAFEFQQRAGTLNFGAGSGQGEAAIGGILDRLPTGGVQYGPPVGAGGAVQGQQHITGVLTLRGNLGYVDASTGGGAAHVGPPG